MKKISYTLFLLLVIFFFTSYKVALMLPRTQGETDAFALMQPKRYKSSFPSVLLLIFLPEIGFRFLVMQKNKKEMTKLPAILAS